MCKVSIYSSEFIIRVNINIKVLYISLTVIIFIIFITFIFSKALLKGLLELLLFLFSLFLLSLFQCMVIRIISFLITDKVLKLLFRLQILILTIYSSFITITGQVIAIIITVIAPICKESISYKLLLLIYNNR